MSEATHAKPPSAFLARFDGPILRKEIVLESPLVRHQFSRSFEHVGRNVHMVSVFGRVLLGEDKIHEAEAAIYKRLEEITKAVERKVATSEVAVKDAGFSENGMASYNKTAPVVAHIVVPAQSRFLKLLELADKYARNFFTLWLNGEINDKEKSKAELELKKLLRQIPSTTRKMRIYVQEKLNASTHEEAKKEAAAMAKEIKDDDVDSEETVGAAVAAVALEGADTEDSKSKKKTKAKGSAEAPALPAEELPAAA